MLEGRTTVAVGGQWGDEGKGKEVDALVAETGAAAVARGQGGANAGHNLYVEALDVDFAAHQLPSGIFHDGRVINIIGQGTVVEPIALEDEMSKAREKGAQIDTDNFMISPRAHVTLPTHRLLDAHGDAIGTTHRGIGPTYADKADRTGLRIEDAYYDRSAVKTLFKKHVAILRVNGDETDDETFAKMLDDFNNSLDIVGQYLHDPTEVIADAINGCGLIVEGAQGVLLDNTVGTYPYVTSSSTTVPGVMAGVDGLGGRFDDAIGVFKLPMTRVGKGPFPTAMQDEEQPIVDLLQGIKGERGAEFGATTGRRRDIGWFDSVMARYACRMGGIETASLTKLDKLDQLSVLKVCVAYTVDGRQITKPPRSAAVLERLVPIYQELPGWQVETRGITQFSKLPARAQKYVQFIEDMMEVRVVTVGTGPGRAARIHR